MEGIEMEDIEIKKLLQSIPHAELVSLLESLFLLDCMKDPAIKDAVLQFEQQEDWESVHECSDENVFAQYMEYREVIGDPLILSEYLAERRQSKYESVVE